ncbi:MAG: hypothetical protein QUS12_02555 [Methanosarcina sp.]|nr:hypothetical protein [Methanosarcina sp.]
MDTVLAFFSVVAISANLSTCLITGAKVVIIGKKQTAICKVGSTGRQFETPTEEVAQSRIRRLADRDGNTSRQYQSAVSSEVAQKIKQNVSYKMLKNVCIFGHIIDSR